MKLYVLRHGEAEPRAASDAERRLTRRGEAEVRAVALELTGFARGGAELLWRERPSH